MTGDERQEPLRLRFAQKRFARQRRIKPGHAQRAHELRETHIFQMNAAAGERLRRLKDFGMTRFRLLFRGSRSRSEIVATFIAVLELCREKVIRLAGSDTDCTVECDENAPKTINL